MSLCDKKRENNNRLNGVTSLLFIAERRTDSFKNLFGNNRQGIKRLGNHLAERGKRIVENGADTDKYG